MCVQQFSVWTAHLAGDSCGVSLDAEATEDRSQIALFWKIMIFFKKKQQKIRGCVLFKKTEKAVSFDRGLEYNKQGQI